MNKTIKHIHSMHPLRTYTTHAALCCLGIALFAASTGKVSAEPAADLKTSLQQIAPDTDPAANIKDMETLNHIMQAQLQGIHDQATADEAVALLQQSRLKLRTILHLLYQLDLPPELDRQKISIESTIGRMLLTYRAELKNKDFYGSDKLRHAMHDFFTPAKYMTLSYYVYPSQYTRLQKVYDTTLKDTIAALAQTSDNTSAETTAENLHYAARSLRSLQARMQNLDIQSGLNPSCPTGDPSLLPQIQNHIKQLQSVKYYDSPALQQTCETLFSPVSDHFEYMEILAQQECDLYTIILDYLSMIDDDTSAEDALLHTWQWTRKLNQLHKNMEQIAPPSNIAQHAILSQRRISMAPRYDQALFRLIRQMGNKKYYGSNELECNMRDLLHSIGQGIDPSIR